MMTATVVAGENDKPTICLGMENTSDKTAEEVSAEVLRVLKKKATEYLDQKYNLNLP